MAFALYRWVLSTIALAGAYAWIRALADGDLYRGPAYLDALATAGGAILAALLVLFSIAAVAYHEIIAASFGGEE